MEEIDQLRMTLLGGELEEMLGAMLRSLGSPLVQELIATLNPSKIPISDRQHTEGLARRTFHLRRWLVFFEEYPLVLAPVSLRIPFPVNQDAKGPEEYASVLDAQKLMGAVNLLGLPAVSVPIGMADGLPTGVQIIGRPFRADLCLDVNQVLEDRFGTLPSKLWTFP